MTTNGATPLAWPETMVAAAENLGAQVKNGAGFVLIAWGDDGACKLQVAPVEMPLTNFVNLLRGVSAEIEKKLTVANALQAQAVPQQQTQTIEHLPPVDAIAPEKRKGGRPKGSKNKQTAPQAVN